MRITSVLSVVLAIMLAAAAAYYARIYINTQVSTANAPQAVSEEPHRTIVVARNRLNFGALIEPSALEEIRWAADTLPAGTFETIEELVVGRSEGQARYAIALMEPGEPIFASKVTSPGQRAKLSTSLAPGTRAMSIRVNDVLGVAGFVLPGDQVDVLLTHRATDGSSVVDILLQGLRVLAIDQIADERKDNPSVVRTVTFEVSTEEAQKLTLGSTIGTLSLALRNFASSEVEETQRITVSDLGFTAVAAALREPIQGEVQRQELSSIAADIALPEPDFISPAPSVEEDEEQEPVQVLQESITPVENRRNTVGVIRNMERSEYILR